jgi:hypothetical protein
MNPLCNGGLDVVSNVQWQTIADAKVKDRWERTICRAQMICPRMRRAALFDRAGPVDTLRDVRRLQPREPL